MGKVTTPPYRAELFVREPSGDIIRQVVGYNVKDAGRPTDTNLEKFVQVYCESLKPGGVNAHVSKGLGYVPFPHQAVIIRQQTKEVVATWRAAAFQVF